jgi:MHS family proline/betaine transporter-like MFS transporter
MTYHVALSKSQKEAVGLLQIGTFLEYFDLMLYVHMAALLNELFFPKTDPHTASLLSAFAFCSSFVFRPFGAMIFGYLGDHIGRKSTVIITTFMMAISCLIMANASTYAQIGVAASWIITICRIMQGMASLGEMVNAEIYLTEITKPPLRYMIVSLIPTASVLGSTFALFISFFFTTYASSNWRAIFWTGASIAVLGSIARVRLRETGDFIEAKIAEKKDGAISTIARKTLLAYGLISFAWPLFFFTAYVYCGNLLKTKFGFTSEQLIQHNLIVTSIDLIEVVALCILSSRIFPLVILRYRWLANIGLICAVPFLLDIASSPLHVGMIQVMCLGFGLSPHPAFAVFFEHFPILKRCSYVALLYATAHSIMYIITSFGMIYLTSYMGHYGLWVIMIPVSCGFYFGLTHFEKIHEERKNVRLPERQLKPVLKSVVV